MPNMLAWDKLSHATSKITLFLRARITWLQDPICRNLITYIGFKFNHCNSQLKVSALQVQTFNTEFESLEYKTFNTQNWEHEK